MSIGSIASSSAQAIKQNARKVVCIGRNYAAHAAELKHPTPDKPFWFLKPTTSICASGHPVWKPKGVELHYEVELGLVMGQMVRNLAQDNERVAMDSIAGYFVGIDMTARNVQEEARKKGLPWSMAKGFDTFLPISQLIPKAKLPDPYAATLFLNVDGKTRQSGSTGLMLFRIPRILASISQVMTLEPGDLVLTGTPAGVGPVQAGEAIDAGIKVDDQQIEEGSINVRVQDSESLYAYESN